MVKPGNNLTICISVFSGDKESASLVIYRRIQFILVICSSLFLLDGDTHDLQIVIEDVYEAGFHVFIYSHTQT